jgi:four helix bundle protein
MEHTGVRSQGSGVKEDVKMAARNVTELTVYRMAYRLAMDIFNLSKRFPAEERFALTGQIRRSSRSVSMNLREAWAKRRYEAHFLSKLTDCDGENAETETSLNFALDCKYIEREEHQHLVAMNHEVGKMLGSMIQSPKGFILARST